MSDLRNAVRRRRQRQGRVLRIVGVVLHPRRGRRRRVRLVAPLGHRPRDEGRPVEPATRLREPDRHDEQGRRLEGRQGRHRAGQARHDHQDPEDRRGLRRRRGDRHRVAQEGPRPLQRHRVPVAEPRARRDRRAPHDVRLAVLGARQARGPATGSTSPPSTASSTTASRARGSSHRRTARCCCRRTSPRSSSRRATRGSRPPNGSSCSPTASTPDATARS